jgi:hypothetical protein
LAKYMYLARYLTVHTTPFLWLRGLAWPG